MIKLPEAVAKAHQTVTDALNGALPGLNEMTTYLTRAMGKGVRTLLLLSAAADSEGNVPENAVKAAAAIELLHMATLVHDDIIDDAPLRRGVETVQRRFGQKRAVICGDYLLCISMSLMASIEVSEDMKQYYTPVARFARALAGICRGEYLQFQNNGNIDLDIFNYFKIISGKTAALFYISASLGGILGGENEANVRAIGRFGRYMGLVFQIIDDCKDYEFSEAAALKPVGKDIAEGVVTLPLIMAISREPALRDAAREAMGEHFKIPRLLEDVRHTGGTEGAKEIARRYGSKAVKAVKNLPEYKKNNLTSLLDKTLAAAAQF